MLGADVAKAIQTDMLNRSGGDEWWAGMDHDVEREVLNAWAAIIDAEIERRTSS